MHHLNVLIVEDESLIAMELTELLISFGCKTARYATTPAKAKNIMQDDNINLILMDINLKSDITGIELYKSFDTKTSIIYITAYSDESTIKKAIETNPLGYLMKPYKKDDLKALFHLATYKINSPENFINKYNDRIELGESYYFDKEKEKLYFNDMLIKLGNKELKLFKLLMYSRGYIVDFKTIEEEVWQDDFVTSSAVRTLIYRLRGKLDYKLIETVHNHGVKLNLETNSTSS